MLYYPRDALLRPLAARREFLKALSSRTHPFKIQKMFNFFKFFPLIFDSRLILLLDKAPKAILYSLNSPNSPQNPPNFHSNFSLKFPNIL